MIRLVIFSLLIAYLGVVAVHSQGAAAGVIMQQGREASLRNLMINDRSRLRGIDDVSRIKANGSMAERLKLETIRQFYGEPTETENEMVLPEAEDIAKYSTGQKGKKIGLIRLLPDRGCDEITFQPKVSDVCKTLTIQGGGSAFSFRTQTHRYWRLADLIFDGRNLIAYGQGSQGFIVRLGDVPLENVSVNSPGVKFMADFTPANHFDQIAKQNLSFVNRVIDGDFLYGKIITPQLNTTYVLRSIAYNTYVPRDFEGIQFNELSFDKRADVIVAFRMIRPSQDGSVTLAWREIRSIRSPGIVEK